MPEWITTKDDINAFFDLLAEEYGKDIYSLFLFRSGTQRLGQAFFNVLPPLYAEALRGTQYDPFYKTDWASIKKAVDFLTSK